MEFFINSIEEHEFNQKRVLEVGSKYVNGSVRPVIEKFFHPREFVGVDIEPGKYVDLILPAERLLEYFGVESFDVVIATELLEHVQDWRLVINNMKGVLKREGYIYITTRSRGFPYHGYPYDFWRYEIDDMRKIFSDFDIISLLKDPIEPGVFLKAVKPIELRPRNMSDITLYSIILGKRTTSIPDIRDMPPLRRLKLSINEVIKDVGKNFIGKLGLG